MKKRFSIGNPLFLTIVVILVLIPFYWMLATAVKSDGEVGMTPPTIIPKAVHPENFLISLSKAPFLKYFRNTLVVAACVILCSTGVSVLSAFAFARLDFPGKNLFFIITLATMMVPQEMLIITNFRTISDWGWMNTYQALIIPYCINASHIYLMRQNMKQIPDELYIASRIDGLNNFQFMLKVILPQVRSAIYTSMLMSMIWVWNTYAWPNLVTTNDSLRLVSNGLKNAYTQSTGDVQYNLQMAAATWVTVPLIIVFIVFRKHILSGVTKGGVKG